MIERANNDKILQEIKQIKTLNKLMKLKIFKLGMIMIYKMLIKIKIPIK